MPGKNGKSSGIQGALEFQARALVLAHGGKTACEKKRIFIKDVDFVTLLIAAATS
jgi:hypothetical protein